MSATLQKEDRQKEGWPNEGLQKKGRQNKSRSKVRTTTMKPKNTPKKKRSAPAAALADPRYRARIVRNAKVYSRKTRTSAREDDDV